MPCCESYWMEFRATRVPSYSPTQSPASAPHAPTPAYLANVAGDEKGTWVPSVVPSTLEADHGNFLNLGPRPEGIYNQTWSNH